MTDLLVKNQLDFLNSVIVEDATTGLFSVDLTGAVAGERGRFKKISDALNAIADVTRSSETGRLKSDPRIIGLPVEIPDGSITEDKLSDEYIKIDGTTGTLTITGKLTVGGVIDPTALILSGSTSLYICSDDGSTAPLSSVGKGYIRYKSSTGKFQISAEGGPYVDIVTGTGVTTFITLTDTPGAYAGDALKVVRVNAGETGLEFSSIAATTPGGADTQVQFNDSGAFGGDSKFTFTKATGVVSLNGPSSTTSPTISFGSALLGGATDFGIAYDIIGGVPATAFRRMSIVASGINIANFTHQPSTGAIVFNPPFGTEAIPGIKWFSTGQNGFYYKTTNPAGVTVVRAGGNICTFGTSGLVVTGKPGTSGFGQGQALKMTPGSHAGIPGGAEQLDVWLTSRTMTMLNPAVPVALQRTVLLEGQTYAFDTAQTLTEAMTLAVTAPVAGANCTITDAYALHVTGHTKLDGKLTVTGSLAHEGSTWGLYSATPVAQGSAIADLTDSSGGTANDTVAAVSGSGADATINDNFADLAAKVNAILNRMRTPGLIAT